MRAGQVWHGFARKCGWTFPFTSYTDLHVSLAKGFLFFSGLRVCFLRSKGLDLQH